MTLKRIIITLSLYLFAFYISAQVNFNSNAIPDELKENANAVIRYESTQFTIKSEKDATLKFKTAVTVLNKNGEENANIYIYYDKFRSVSNYKGVVYDNAGKVILKIKPKDFEDRAMYSGASLFDDNRIKYFKVFQNNYPYTVEYEYTINYNGFNGFPGWNPIKNYDVSVQHASYEIIANKDYSFHYKSFNINQSPEKSTKDNQIIYKWTVENIRPFEKEPYSTYFADYVPQIVATPDKFYFDGSHGTQETWEEYGKWVSGLLENRDIITDKTKQEIVELTKGIDDEKLKVKKIYEYMQSKTRYVSIQLGIGGFQPFSALEVDQLGYGDCKALSNYTKSLLSAVGIESIYSEIMAGNYKRDYLADFPGPHIGNHIILCVPLKSDTIWLECTSQTNPFGYLGSFTDDRYALLIKPEGSKLVKTIKYSKKDNMQSRAADIVIQNDCSVNAKINTVYKAIQYDNVSYQFRESKEEQRENLFDKIDLNNFDIVDFNYVQHKDIIPSAEEYIELNVNNYASISGERMFLPLNFLNKQSYIPKKLSERKSDILLDYAFSDYDTISYTIPKDYEIEFIPDTTIIESPFGEYKSFATVENNSLKYIRINTRNEGKFPKESYPELIQYFKDIWKADRQKAILIKKTSESGL